MKLREWIEVSEGRLASRAELDRFETGLLESNERAIRDGHPELMSLDADPPQEIWDLCFTFARTFLRGFGAW